MNISLDNKKALIGGSSSGIGKAIARQLAGSGASVTLMSRSEEKLKDIIAELPTTDGQSHNYLLVDFTDFEGYQKIIKEYKFIMWVRRTLRGIPSKESTKNE